MAKSGDRSRFPYWRDGLTSILLVAVWLYANHSALSWLGQSIRLTFEPHSLLIGIGLTAMILQLRRNWEQLGFTGYPVLRLVPLLLLLGSATGTVALHWFWDVQQISVLLFALGSYGLWGLFIAPTTWRKGLPVALLVVCLLPFGTQFGTGLGFPLRILTAHAIERLLHGWNITAISANDIIVTENGIARIDLPCSGLRGLWIGTLFLLAVTWLERRQLGLRWLLVYATSLWLFISANLMRVLLLVLLTHVLKQPHIAAMLHVPLGLLGFGFACGVGWGLLQWVPKQDPEERWQPDNREASDDRFNAKCNMQNVRLSEPQSRRHWMLLIGAIAGLGVVASLHTSPSLRAIALPQLPSHIQTTPISLTPVEQKFFGSSEATRAQKWRFADGNLTGSMLMVSSRSWNAFHPPELCLVGSGLKVDRMEKRQLTQDVLARWLSLQDGKLSATYWLQSSQQTTDDFRSRLWAYGFQQHKAWVMVSVLFDQTQQPPDPAIQRFVTMVHQAVHQSFTRNLP